MSILILGLVLFLGIHIFTTLRAPRAAIIGRLGEGPYKGLYSAVAGLGLVLIIWGFSRYRDAGYIQIWHPPFALFHPVALVLLWFAFVSLAAAYAPPSRIKSLLRHPMLVAVKAWALSHLLVNGDLGSLLLDDMKRALDYFKQHPVHTPMTSDEASGFHHELLRISSLQHK